MVTGVEELIAKLQSLKKTKAKAAIRKGTRAGSKIIQQVAKRLAPSKSGKLQAAVKVRSIKRSRVWTGSAVTLSLSYASYGELGTKDEKALHFLQRSAKQAGEQAKEACMEIIKQEILKI